MGDILKKAVNISGIVLTILFAFLIILKSNVCIKSALSGEKYIPPSDEEFKNTIITQIKMMIENKGEYIAVREARKHLSWYTKGRYGSASLRDEINKVETAERIMEIIERM